MAFSNSEFSRHRKGWVRETELSDPTDPDYAEKAEQRLLKDMLTLSEDEVILLIGAYSPKRQDELLAKFFELKKRFRKP